MVKTSNLSDVASQQTALNNVTAVGSATNEYVLTKDTATGNAVFKASVGGAGGGQAYTEASTAPISPTVGDEWLSTANGVLYKYISDGVDSYWVAISGNGVVTGGGGAWTLIDSTVVSTAVPTIEFTNAFDGTYKAYRIIVHNLGTSGANETVQILFKIGTVW